MKFQVKKRRILKRSENYSTEKPKQITRSGPIPGVSYLKPDGAGFVTASTASALAFETRDFFCRATLISVKWPKSDCLAIYALISRILGKTSLQCRVRISNLRT